MSNEEIVAMSRKAARDSAAQGVHPMILEQEDIDDAQQGKRSIVNGIPFIGDRRPRGWRHVKLDKGHGVYDGYCSGAGAFFVDASGWGKPGELALTFDEFVAQIKPGLGYAIVEVGEFQIAIGVFERTKSTVEETMAVVEALTIRN
jgi:hypothetical protein